MLLSRLYLNKCLTSNLEKVKNYQERLAATKKKVHLQEDQDDIKLAKVKSQRRLETKWPSVRESAATARIDEKKTRGAEASELPKSRGLASQMRTRSSSG